MLSIFASRGEITFLNGLQVQHAVFLSQHKSILQCCWDILPLEDEVAVPESHPGCFTFRPGRPSCLSSAPWSRKSGSDMMRWAPAFGVLPHRSERLSCFLSLSWGQPGMQKPGVYLNRDPDVLRSCYCPSPDAVSFPHPTTAAGRRNSRVFSLQNEERN